MDIRSSLKKLPSVESILEDKRVAGRITPLSQRGITRIVRRTIDRYREQLRSGGRTDVDAAALRDSIVADVVAELDSITRDVQRRVINATGVILHTNLGRAVLGADAVSAIERASSGYVDLEIDTATATRVKRARRVRRLLTLIMDVEDALVVNNNAAAVFLAVNTLAGSGAVAVSRGELVEIGGSFRLPEILASAAERVIEVGTTNRTHVKDYEQAIREGATVLLKVHTSNYRIVGYTNEVSLRELAEVGRAHGVPVMYDQGSGVLYPLENEGVSGEESIGRVRESGVDLISFSADKVLGGTQGGILLGPSSLIGAMRENHLSRTLRVDKLALAGLETVLLQYWNGDTDSIPAIRMITASVAAIRERAERFAASLRMPDGGGIEVRTVDGESSIGGGSFPINPLRTVLVEITIRRAPPERLAETLGSGDPAVLLRVRGDAVYVDLRSVTEAEEETLRERLEKGFEELVEGG
jgi:L-seryl-tRNA(Ser) seleniumtransferase